MSCENNTKILPLSEIFTNMPDSGYEVRVTDTLIISPKITYDFNSTYSWKLNDDVVSTQKDLTLIPKELNFYNYIFDYENDRGSGSVKLWAQSMYITDFEDLIIYENTESTDTFWVNSGLKEYFISDSLKFEVNGSYNDESWTGFTYSNMSGNKTSNEYDKFSCYSTTSDYESVNFGVMMQDKNQTPLTVETSDGKDHLFKSLMVNNSYYVYDAITNGKYNSKTFGGDDTTDPDYLILTINGYNKNNILQGTTNYYLANYTHENYKDDEITTEWTTVDLELLGKVSRLEFELSSSDIVDGEMRTPGYFCIDEIKIIE